MSNLSIRNTTEQYYSGGRGIHASDMNYLLSKAGNKFDYSHNNDSTNDNRDNVWGIEQNGEDILIRLGLIWRNGTLCKMEDQYEGVYTQKISDELNFVKLVFNNVPAALDGEESSKVGGGLTGDSAIWYVLMLSNDQFDENKDNFEDLMSTVEFNGSPAVTANKYHIMKYTRNEVQKIYSGLPTHIDSCKKIIGVANFTQSGKFINSNNSFLKDSLQESFTQQPWDLLHFDNSTKELYIFNGIVKDEVNDKIINPEDFENSDNYFGIDGLTKLELHEDDINYIFLEYNSDLSEGVAEVAEVVVVGSEDLVDYLSASYDNEDTIKRLIWTIELSDNNEVIDFKRHLSHDIYLTKTDKEEMPFEIISQTPSSGGNSVEITVRNGVFVGSDESKNILLVDPEEGESVKNLEDYDFDKYNDYTLTPENQLLVAFIKEYPNVGGDEYSANLTACPVDYSEEESESIYAIPIAMAMFPEPTSSNPSPEPYAVQLTKGFITVDLNLKYEALTFRVIGGDRLEVYIPNNNPDEDIVYYNGKSLSADYTINEGDFSRWYDAGLTLPGTSSEIYLYIKKKESSNIDLSNPDDMEWGISTTPKSDFWEQSIKLADILKIEEKYKIIHYRRGSVNINQRLPDAFVLEELNGDSKYHQKSLNFIDGENGSLQIFDFDKQTKNEDEIEDLNFLVSEEKSGERVVSYLDGQDILDLLGFEDVIHSFKPIKTGTSTATIIPGRIYLRDLTYQFVSFNPIDFSNNKFFWIVIDYSSNSYDILHILAGSPDGYPEIYDAAEQRINIPIFEFPDNTFSSLKRHIVGDFMLNQFCDSEIGGNFSIERNPGNGLDRDGIQIRSFHDSDEFTVPYSLHEGEVKEVTWVLPIEGPGGYPGLIEDGKVITELEENESDDLIQLAYKYRKHEVFDGREVWGEELEDNINLSVNWPNGYKYMVWQIRGTNDVGWDWVRAH